MASTDLGRWPLRIWPDSLLGRMVLVLVIGVVSAQLVGTYLLARQLRANVRNEALGAARNLAANAAGSIPFFRDLPPAQRPLLIEQLRTMGGTRFFVHINHRAVPVESIAGNALVDAVVAVVRTELQRKLAGGSEPLVQFAWPQGLGVSVDGRVVGGMPEPWAQATLMLQPRPAPVLVIQTEFEPGHWLFLAATMPDPYFLDKANPLTPDRVALQLGTLLVVLLLVLAMARGLVKPIDRIAQAANAFDSAIAPEPIAETGTAELRRTARAFNAMQARIQGYLLDRQRLFIGISHSLKTPIMRLKLRTELLDDEAMRAEFHDDLDDLDVMVKSALQSLRDTDIHENLVELRLDILLERLVQRPIHPHAVIAYAGQPMRIPGKPLALQRALGNLLDNAVLYGGRVQVRLGRLGPKALVEIRDFGPGLSEPALAAAMDPDRARSEDPLPSRSGSGLGLGIARNIVQAHGGEIRLHNHAQGGLVVAVLLPALPEELD